MEDTAFFLEPVPLTRKEAALREKLETEVFQTVRDAYIYIGELLGEIRNKRLYKSTHRSFDDYCPEVLDMARQSVERYINAAEVVRNLRTNWCVNSMQLSEITIPQNESQARALVKLESDEQCKAWFKAVETAPEGKITAAHVRKTVRDLGLEKIKEKVETAKRAKKKNGSRISEDFQEAFNGFLAAVQTEITGSWKTTDRLMVVRHLDGIRGAISVNGNHKIPEKGYAIEASNLEKLGQAGFSIFRAEEKKQCVEYYDMYRGCWILHGDFFETVEAMNAAFEELLKEQNSLRG